MFAAVLTFLQSLTLEPCLFFAQIGYRLVDGNAMNVDLVMEKLCLDTLAEDPEVCSNLADYPPVQDEVQIMYNNFETGKKIIGTFPGVLYALVCKDFSW